MTVKGLHRILGDMMRTDPNVARLTILQARDPEGNGTPMIASHIELGNWTPRHDTFTSGDEIERAQAFVAEGEAPDAVDRHTATLKINAAVIWPR